MRFSTLTRRAATAVIVIASLGAGSLAIAAPAGAATQPMQCFSSGDAITPATPAGCSFEVTCPAGGSSCVFATRAAIRIGYGYTRLYLYAGNDTPRRGDSCGLQVGTAYGRRCDTGVVFFTVAPGQKAPVFASTGAWVGGDVAALYSLGAVAARVR